MSNAYVNQILFGNSKTNVDAQYIRDLLPLMLSETRMTECRENLSMNTINTTNSENPSILVDTSYHSPTISQMPIPFEHSQPHNNIRHSPTNTLFWAIYESEHPEDAFMNGTRANTEINHRLKVVTELKKTPKRLKETNAKLTIEQTQALLGSMMVAKEDKLDFCIAYAAYYNKPIMVVYQKTYCLFSPMIDIDIKDEDVILLYASLNRQQRNTKTYSLEHNITKQIICDIVDTKVASPLKAMSNYKTPELEEIAAKLQIETKQKDVAGKEKRRKKEDIYNDIKVAIHTDQN